MARAATPAANSEILQSHADLTEQRAAYHYELSTSQNAVNFSVTDGAQSLFPDQFAQLMQSLRVIAPAVGRTI